METTLRNSFLEPTPAHLAADFFTEAELKEFRRRLEDKKREILAEVQAILVKGRLQLDANEMKDEVDIASVAIDQELTFKLLERLRALLAEVEHALRKIDSGDYGYCEGTGDLIPKKRLLLAPWTRHSVEHKEYLEKLIKKGRGIQDE